MRVTYYAHIVKPDFLRRQSVSSLHCTGWFSGLNLFIPLDSLTTTVLQPPIDMVKLKLRSAYMWTGNRFSLLVGFSW